jgi:uncharacterized membrane protein
MIRLEAVYILAGGLFAVLSVLSALDKSNPKRWGNAAFWGLFATSFLFGSRLTDLANGVLVLARVAIAGFGGLGMGTPASVSPAMRLESARRLGNWIFVPALTIPAVTLFGSLVLKTMKIGGLFLIDPKQATVISLALGVVIAIGIGMAMLRPPALAPFQEGRRLLDTVGWAAVLPQMLAALGAVFTLAGVGAAVNTLVGHVMPMDSPLAAVCAYTFGMALFTVIMGNGFAAFPVMTAGIGLPLIVRKFGGDPSIMAAIGMLSGFCGTLLTPMAANFNLVPAALLELPDRYAVIRAQAPTAAILLLANTLLMYFLVFRF